MKRKTAGNPMVSRTRAIMRPRRVRSSMILVAIMPTVGTGDPRRSRECPAGAGWAACSGAGAPLAGMVVIPGPPAWS